mgnify:FL=1
MKIKINKKHYLLGVITLLFIVALGLIGWVKGAGAIHKDLRLRIDTLDFKYYNSDIKFSLKDSIIPNGYSPRCEYFVFEETEEGYDVPLSCSYIPSFIHPSVYRWTRYGYDDKNDNNINHIIDKELYVSYEFGYIYSLILKKAQAKGASLFAILPSYSDSSKRGRFADIEVDGRLLSDLAKEVVEEPEELVDSLMKDIYGDLSDYCGSEHCNVGHNYVEIVIGTLSDKEKNAFDYLFSTKRDKAKECLKRWLDTHTEQFRQLSKDCPEIYNAAHQLSDSYQWVNKQNYAKLDSLFLSSDYEYWDTEIMVTEVVEEVVATTIEKAMAPDTVLYRSDKVNKVLKLIGHDGNDKDLKRLFFNIELWSRIWKEGEAEWTNKWMKKIME